MTDPQPDPLFEALRQQLADYGQEPPAELWAGIRQQLPPPVALPQRRRRRAGLLLAALLLLVSVGSWLGGHLSNFRKITKPAQVARTSPSAAYKNSPSITSSNPAAGNEPAARPAARAAAATTGQSGPTIANVASPKVQAAKVAAGSRLTHSVAVPAQAAEPMPLAAGAARHSAVAQLGLAADGKAARRPEQPAKPVAAATTSTRHKAHTSWLRNTPLAVVRELSPSPGNARLLKSTRPAGIAPAAISEPAASTIRSSPALPATSPTAGSTGSGQLATTEAATRVQSPTRMPAEAAGPLATTGQPKKPLLDWLAARPVGLLRQPWPALPQPAAADTVSRSAVPAARRWAVQLALGPSLSYRQLTPATSLASTASTTPNTIPNTAFGPVSSPDVATLERPALGFSGQVQLRRVLTGRWALAGGLGYREYATALAMQLYQVSAASGVANLPLDSVHLGTIRRRNTYRYLTVPVQASYALGLGWGRLQPSLLAGAELGLYLGGTTTEGPACSCQARTWTATGSPYRSLSLALSLGLELRYRLGPPSGPWELLAQPTFTYGLTSLARPGAGYADRRPYTAGLTVGAAYRLH